MMKRILSIAVILLSFKRSAMQIIGLSKQNETTISQSEAAGSGKILLFIKSNTALCHLSAVCFSISAWCVDEPWGEVAVACVLGPDTNCAIHVRRNVQSQEACLNECADNNRTIDVPSVVFIWYRQVGKCINIDLET